MELYIVTLYHSSKRIDISAIDLSVDVINLKANDITFSYIKKDIANGKVILKGVAKSNRDKLLEVSNALTYYCNETYITLNRAVAIEFANKKKQGWIEQLESKLEELKNMSFTK